MCGRYYFVRSGTDEKLEAIGKAMEKHYPGQYKTGEIFPGDAAPAVIQRQGRLTAVPAIFGFPGFQEGKLLLNARAETAAEKKSFAEGLRERRVILPATGFFEWSHDREKTKYLFTLESSKVLYLCGIYKPIDDALHFVILTREANESMSEIHDRMPVIVEEREVRPYLTDRRAAMEILVNAAPRLVREPA